MKRLTFQPLRLRPWLHAAVILYLLGAVFLISVHQHHGALHNSDCALCTISHMPALVAPAAEQLAQRTPASILLPAPDDRGWDAEFFQASRSRAPPQV